jgi:hypothetical protein
MNRSRSGGIGSLGATGVLDIDGIVVATPAPRVAA